MIDRKSAMEWYQAICELIPVDILTLTDIADRILWAERRGLLSAQEAMWLRGYIRAGR